VNVVEVMNVDGDGNGDLAVDASQRAVEFLLQLTRR